MNLVSITCQHLSWVFSLIGRARTLTPWELSGAVAAFLLSQLFFVLSFFLPLKAILLLAIEGVPWYLAPIVTPELKDELVIGIAVSAIASYGLYLLCNSLVGAAAKRGSRHILRISDKLHVFNKQDRLAYDGYLKLSQVLGAILMVVLGMLVGIIINPFLFIALIVILGLEYVALYFVLQGGNVVSERLSEVLKDRLGVAGNYFSAINFLIGFGILFTQFMTREDRHIVIAIISILLVRQLTQRIRMGVLDISFLSKNSKQLGVLFYESIPYTPPKHKQSEFDPLGTSNRNEWLASLLETVVGRGIVVVNSKWVDVGRVGVACFELSSSWFERALSKRCATGGRFEYFAKCFDKKSVVTASHEALLFNTMTDGVATAPEFLGDVAAGDSHILVFKGLPEAKVDQRAWKSQARYALQKQWEMTPDRKLLRAYLRTHATIIDRLSIERLASMHIAVDDQVDEDGLSKFMDMLPEIKHDIESLPLVIRNPDFSPSLCRINESGDICCYSWSRWSIEPMGCSNLILKLCGSELREMFDALSTGSDGAAVEEWVVVANLFELEMALNRNQMREALGLARKVVALKEQSNVERGILRAKMK